MRDLAWVINSPALLTQSDAVYAGDKVSDVWCRRVYQRSVDWLEALDHDPNPLQQWLDQNPSPLLGIYFERLLAFWVQHVPEMQLLARNLVVLQPGRHIGEFDLLFRDLPSDELVYWEVAVKFYLRYGRSHFEWLGPNPRDSLQRKLNKVFARQLQLHQHPAARRLLQQQFGRTAARSQAFIKGYLFYPHDSDWHQPESIPAAVSHAHLKGWWCRHAELPGWLSRRAEAHRWCVLRRLQWLAPAYIPDGKGVLTRDELLDHLHSHFAQHYQALLLAELRPVSGGWYEVSRGFVVNQHWPK